MNIRELREKFVGGEYDEVFGQLYGKSGDTVARQRERYLKALESFSRKYPGREEVSVFSAPGRTEVGGNHTDHQNGCVLAAAVNLDIIAVVSFHEEQVIRFCSEGYPEDCLELGSLAPREEEKGTSASLIRGIISQFHEKGISVGGFDAYATSEVLSGSGLSSSAAFEVLVGTIVDCHYNERKAGPVEIAKIGQYAENVYFGKKSGLMDQMVSSVGNFVFIDFKDESGPEIRKLSCAFEDAGYMLCITDTKGSHADLTEDYVSVPAEMDSVAAQFGKGHLREVSEEEFYRSLPALRGVCSDRAILRAAHFFGDNRRAEEEARALSENSFGRFLCLVKESGASSAKWLQNLYSCRKPEEQGIPLGLLASEEILGERGACRVHGGGFAGTIQAFVPKELVKEYSDKMNALFGEGSCYILRVREAGGTQVV